MKLLVSKRLAKRWRQEFEARDDEDGERIELARRWQQYSLTANLLNSAILTSINNPHRKKTFGNLWWDKGPNPAQATLAMQHGSTSINAMYHKNAAASASHWQRWGVSELYDVGRQGERAVQGYSAREHVQYQVDHDLGFQLDGGLQPSSRLYGPHPPAPTHGFVSGSIVQSSGSGRWLSMFC